MATAHVVHDTGRTFAYEKWERLLPALAARYRENRPCPHILLEDFIDPAAALTMAEEFPQPASDAWTQYKHANENKLGMPKREFFPPTIGAVVDELNSPEFVARISELTGIPGLMADPMLEGGGAASIGSGRILKCAYGFFHAPLPYQLAPAGESDFVFESGMARGVGRGFGIVGGEDGALRREVSTDAESRADFYDG